MNKSTEKVILENKKTKKVAPPAPKPKLARHKYKCDVGKKSYTFKNKKDMSDGLGLSRTVTNKIIKGELGSDKLKISMI